MNFEEEDKDFFPLTQKGYSSQTVSTQIIACLGTPGACGCADCKKYIHNPFARKVKSFFDDGSNSPVLGWVWQDETMEKYAKMTAERERWTEKCESTYGYCGCEDCNRILIAAQQKGLEDIIATEYKYMEMDTGKFVWNYDEVSKKLNIKF
jgi:hypothetical protein